MSQALPVTATRENPRGSNQSELRAHNERLVLSLLRFNGPTAKAEIARQTGLSAQTVSVIMRSLEAEGLIEKGDPVRGKVGQPSTPMRLAANGAFFFGVKVGRRSADVVLIDLFGNLIDRVHQTYSYPVPDQTINFIKQAVADLTAKMSEIEAARIGGLGVAIPGFLWEWASDIGAPAQEMDAWRGRDIQAELSDEFPFPVYLRNDASCACAAELAFGQERQTPHFLYFYVGHFVGGGVVLNGSLFTGPTGNAGAIGTLPVPSSETGVPRQLVSVASLSSLEAAITEAGFSATSLWEDPNSWDVPDDILANWIEQAAGGLAYAIASACSVIDFELVIIDGWMPDLVKARLMLRTRARMSEFNLSGIRVPELREGIVGPEARSLGAASIPLSKRFMVDRDGNFGG